MFSKVRRYPQKVLNWVLDTVFPKVCISCGKFTNSDALLFGWAHSDTRGQRPRLRHSDTDFDYVCKKCFRGIELKNAFECIGCKRQTRLGLTCAFCAKGSQIDQLLIAAELADPLIEKMLKVYKYKFISDMVKPLSVIAKKYMKRLLSKGFNLFEENPLLVPVPLYKTRFNKRGFNQSQLLAKELADAFLVSYSDGVLSRAHNPRNQADIKAREERLNNVRGNFVLTDGGLIQRRTIVLVDDICTTGATLNECARALKEGGAKKVIGFVITRGTTETQKRPMLAVRRRRRSWRNRKNLYL